MKRVKVMLTAIGVLAVVGGALAFKAGAFNNHFYCTKLGPVAGTCEFATPLNRTAVSGSGILYTTTTNSSTCTALRCETPASEIRTEG